MATSVVGQCELLGREREDVRAIRWEDAKALGMATPEGVTVDLTSVQVTVCGGGNAAHAAAAMFSALGCHTNIYLSLTDEVERMREGVEDQGIRCVQSVSGRTLRHVGYPSVSGDPSSVGESDVVVVLAPGFAHEPILRQIEPFLAKGALLGAMPAHGGFDLIARHVFGRKIKDVTLFGTTSLPWACRLNSYGRSVEILGTKKELVMCCHPRRPHVPIVPLFEQMFVGTTFPMGGEFLEVALWPANSIVHPGILYARWRRGTGEPLEEPPLFYAGVDDDAASVLQALSDEVQGIRKAAERALGTCLNVPDLRALLLQFYGHDVTDQSSLKRIFQTNPAYGGLTHPMTRTEDGRYVPNFKHRYLTEDVPHGLAVLRGIATLLEVSTPVMDQVLCWAQDASGSSYLVNGQLVGIDVDHSGCPQRFGFTRVEDLVF